MLKFGGTSVGTDPTRLAEVAARVAAVHAEGVATVVVVSARGGTTDELIRQAYETSSAPDHRELDQLLATGETAAAALLAIALHDRGVPAMSLLGGQAGIGVDGAHLDGRIAHLDTSRLRDITHRGRVAVVAGFQGLNRQADVTTLGRGGSDITASALAVALGAGTCEIYTDVAGVYTADPRVVPTARLITRIGNDSMTELASAGAQVLHPRSVLLAGRHGVDIHVRSAFSSEPGTLVVATAATDESRATAAVAYDADVARVIVPPAATHGPRRADVLGALAAQGVAIDIVAPLGGREPPEGGTHGTAGWEFTVAAREVDRAVRILASHDVGGAVDGTVARISVVDAVPADREAVTSRLLDVLAAAGIEPHGVSVSPLRCSATVPRTAVHQAVRVLHDEFCVGGRQHERAAQPTYA